MIENYYKILTHQQNEDLDIFTIKFNSDSEIFRGHFPDQPICPGVANIQMIVDLASTIVHEDLTISDINKCRFLSLLTPDISEVQIDIKLQQDRNNYKIESTIHKDETTFLLTKMTLKKA